MQERLRGAGARATDVMQCVDGGRWELGCGAAVASSTPQFYFWGQYANQNSVDHSSSWKMPAMLPF